jgi:hypothetical protein
MSIVSSAITKDRDHGFARFVEESHTDSDGKIYVRRRFVAHGYDATADLPTHAAELNNMLADREAQELLDA